MAAAAFILILTAVFSFVLVSRTRESARDVETGRDVRIAASKILTKLLDAETGQRGYLLTARENYLEPYEEAKRELPLYLAELRSARSMCRKSSAEADQIAGIARNQDEGTGADHRNFPGRRARRCHCGVADRQR